MDVSQSNTVPIAPLSPVASSWFSPVLRRLALGYRRWAAARTDVSLGRVLSAARSTMRRKQRRRRFMSTWWAFFPQGPDGSDFILLRFKPERIEVWDGARRVTPPPFGLRSAALTLTDGQWRCG